jgi:O-antigen/teichoic acid export membrane protein
MSSSLVRRVARGLGANAYAQSVTLAVQIAGVPILLQAWGAQLYGEWLILFAIPAYLSMSDLGFSQAAANDMTARVARKDHTGALVTFQSLLVLVHVVAVAGLLVVAALVALLPFHEWLRASILSAEQVRWIVWLLAAEVLVGILDGPAHAGLRASGDYALHVAVVATTRLVQFLTIWSIAFGGATPVTAAAGFLAAKLVGVAVSYALMATRHRWIEFGTRRAAWSEIRRTAKPAAAYMSIPMGQVLNVQGMTIVVGATIGPLAVVTFATLRTLTRSILQTVLSVTHTLQPELETASGHGNRSLLISLYAHALRAALALSTITGLVLLLCGDLILETWTQGRVHMDRTLFHLLVGGAILSVAWYGALGLLKALNCHLRSSLLYLSTSVGAVLVAAILLRVTQDLFYAGLSLLLVELITGAYVVRSAGTSVEMTPAQMIRRVMSPSASPAIAIKVARPQGGLLTPARVGRDTAPPEATHEL